MCLAGEYGFSMVGVFLFDAARECGMEARVSDYLAQIVKPQHSGLSTQHSGLPPIYCYARDCGEYLKSHAAAKRLGIDRIIAAAWENLEHGPSLEAFSFA